MRTHWMRRLKAFAMVSGFLLACSSTRSETESPEPARETNRDAVQGTSATEPRCTLSPSERSERLDEATHKVFQGVEEVRELPEGYAFRFPFEESRVQRLTEFIVKERLCCDFFTFELVFEPSGGPVWLRLHGPGGTKEMIKSFVQQPLDAIK